eukprot:TRINITY_DN640_c0_g1_i1.p1 TRINITY_DN640_c0_g1~~TRINITY_DN640_c0_g1_i1.p1  ORF type:complete len:310 (-),score=54.91 TRINITY_DN640_c0_g1_i1:235-1164(-)
MSTRTVLSFKPTSAGVRKSTVLCKALGLPQLQNKRRYRNKFAVSCQAAEEPEKATVGVVTEEVAENVAEESAPVEPTGQSSPKQIEEGFVPVLKLEDLPKGVRKEVRVDGQNVLLFWYRNDIFAIEARSPAEGAYSEGFITAKFTQDYGIECPSTKSVFSLKNGEILDWYPDNFVLRTLTPASTCRSLEIYPISVIDDTVYVNVSGGTLGGVSSVPTRGGTTTSVEQNNVFGLQPQMYVEGGEEKGAFDVSSFATLVVSFTAVTLIGTVGTAVSLFYEDYVLLGLFWAVLVAVCGFFGFQYIAAKRSQQ